MTGVQALERNVPDRPMRPGKLERQEFEYIRHGTQTLIASFDVVSGKIIQSTVGDTRTELDYIPHSALKVSHPDNFEGKQAVVPEASGGWKARGHNAIECQPVPTAFVL